ncbi:MAG: hypothetical protein KDJ73_10850 [Notoacmeibacter sp.]|nr:hypothetical protein [Notoacmeibacter sp.]MCC0033293.1 hypothetical protein [Brucellaceae bacterium]
MTLRLAITIPLLLASGLPALAACRQELALYADTSKTATLEFVPHDGEAVTVTNRFRLVAGEKVIEGFVQWSGAPAPRPYGMLTDQCPDGDVTGEELEACTVWQGAIYAVGSGGAVGLLPGQGEDAAQSLVLSDLARAMSQHRAYAETKLAEPPFDVFTLSGCQE